MARRENNRRFGIFLSHSSSDKPFARKLGTDLRAHGAYVWLDEAEIKVGDSLIEKIGAAIGSTDTLLALLSKRSVRSAWVRRELNIALTHEIHRKRVKVLPCLLETCPVPPFLLDKKYADFRDPKRYFAARNELITAIGLEPSSAEKRFLDQFVFYDLVDLNTGFDVPSIRYFDLRDFQKVLDRCEVFGIEIYGIEPHPNGVFAGVEVLGEHGNDAADPTWYRAAFERLVASGIKSHFAASYGVPKNILTRFVEAEEGDADS